MSLLFFFLLPFLAPARFSCNILSADSCQSLNSIEALPKLKYVPYLTIVIDDTVDIHEAALAFTRLMCVIRLQADQHSGSGVIGIFPVDQSRWLYCCHQGIDPYKFFIRQFSKKIVARENLCDALRHIPGQRLIFSGVDGTYCADDPHPTLTLLLGRWYKGNDIRYPNGSLVKSPAERAVARRTLYPLDVQQPGSYVSAYALVYRLAEAPFNSSLVGVYRETVIRVGDKDSPLTNRGLVISCFYMACLLVFIVVLFLSLLDLVNVDENYNFVLQRIIQHRVRRQRARLAAENGENREDEEGEEEGEEAVERSNRRNRLNSEERSLLGTDENTIRTALSARFPSVSSLSFHSTGSRPRRTSLDSLEEVVVDPSDEVTDGKEEKEKLNK